MRSSTTLLADWGTATTPIAPRRPLTAPHATMDALSPLSYRVMSACQTTLPWRSLTVAC